MSDGNGTRPITVAELKAAMSAQIAMTEVMTETVTIVRSNTDSIKSIQDEISSLSKLNSSINTKLFILMTLLGSVSLALFIFELVKGIVEAKPGG